MGQFTNRLNGNALFALAQLTRRTGRFQVRGLEHLDEARANGRPLIFAAWHGMTMMLVGFFASQFDLSSIVLILPDDWRGETLTVFANKLGAAPFPMNLKGDASMATARRLAQLVRQVKQGQNCYLTPDGPDGPAYVIKPGLTYIAQKASAAILPLGAYARHGYRLPRWDRYVLPFPFSRISIQVGAPVRVQKGDDLTAVSQSLTNQLHRVTMQAAANYYEQAP